MAPVTLNIDASESVNKRDKIPSPASSEERTKHLARVEDRCRLTELGCLEVTCILFALASPLAERRRATREGLFL